MIGSIVVLYNPTEKEIKNINEYISVVDYAVIVDNSECDNKELILNILKSFEKITYISEGKNLGLCKGFNIGVNILKQKGCNWALLFDADSKVVTDVVAVYKKAIEDNKDNNVAVFSPVHLFDRSNNKEYTGYKNVDWSMTSGWLVNIEIFQKQGGFFEELFVDGLDMDYCFKSRENGYKIIECGNACLQHNPAKTKKILFFKYGIASPFRYYMQARQLIWCWKRYKVNKIIFIYLYKWFKVLFLFPNKIKYFKEMLRGTKEGMNLWRIYQKKN